MATPRDKRLRQIGGNDSGFTRLGASYPAVVLDPLPVKNSWHSVSSAWLASLRAAGASRNTLSLRRYQLVRFADDFPGGPPTLTRLALERWLASHQWAPATLRSYRSAIRSFCDWAHEVGLLDEDPAARLRKVNVPPAKPRPAAERAIDAALAATAGRREWLMLMLGSRHGLRRIEISRVHTTDMVEAADGWPELIVHGKGNRDRRVPLLPVVAQAIADSDPGWLFPSRNPEQHLTAGHIGVLLRPVLSGATPHQLRHRCASRAYQATHDIRAVQELLGHASVATTQIYTAVANDAVRRAVESAA